MLRSSHLEQQYFLLFLLLFVFFLDFLLKAGLPHHAARILSSRDISMIHAFSSASQKPLYPRLDERLQVQSPSPALHMWPFLSLTTSLRHRQYPSILRWSGCGSPPSERFKDQAADFERFRTSAEGARAHAPMGGDVPGDSFASRAAIFCKIESIHGFILNQRWIILRTKHIFIVQEHARTDDSGTPGSLLFGNAS